MNAPSGLTLPRPGELPSSMSKTPPMNTTRPPTSQSWAASSAAPTTVIPKPMSVSPSGVRPIGPSRRGRLEDLLDRPRDSFEMVITSTGHAQDRVRVRRAR
jgi:hypothetical protein